MKRLFKFIIALSFFVGCATPPKPRLPSEYLLSTDRAVSNSIADIRQEIEKRKYQVKVQNVAAGILTTSPRKFTYKRGNEIVKAQHTLQFRQEGGSVKLRIQYECEYTANKFEACHMEDQDGNQKISRVESALIQIVKAQLTKVDKQEQGDDDLFGNLKPPSKNVDEPDPK